MSTQHSSDTETNPQSEAALAGDPSVTEAAASEMMDRQSPESGVDSDAELIEEDSLQP